MVWGMTALPDPLAQPDWMARGACHDHPELNWFPDGKDAGARAQITAACAVCATCPVKGLCREAGMWEDFGIWGGLTASRRRRMRSGQERPEWARKRVDRVFAMDLCGTDSGYYHHLDTRGGKERTRPCEACKEAHAGAEARRAAARAPRPHEPVQAGLRALEVWR